MLLLGRRIGETILIGENIVVRVVEWKGGQVRLGIEAPKEVHILRGELANRAKAKP